MLIFDFHETTVLFAMTASRRSQLRDMWNVVAVGGGLEYGAEGQPLANSHYGYHLVS